jgi:hypothetical protein
MGQPTPRQQQRTIGTRMQGRKPFSFEILYVLLAAAAGSILTYLAMRGSAFVEEQQQYLSYNKAPGLNANNVVVQSLSEASVQIPASTSSTGIQVSDQKREKSFYEVGVPTNTDKVAGSRNLPACLANDEKCIRPGCVREECRPWGHWYHTMYQQRLGKYTLPDTEPFQFLEIGFVSCCIVTAMLFPLGTRIHSHLQDCSCT